MFCPFCFVVSLLFTHSPLPWARLTSIGVITVSLYFVVLFLFCGFVQFSVFSLIVCAVLLQLFYCHFVSQTVVALNHGGRV